jgi:DDE superfamily endonuclease
VTTTKPKAAAAARIGAALAARKRGELLALLRPCFSRVEPWLQAGKYVAAVASDVPKRNGWTIAQQAGDRAPQRTQRLLNRAAWDTFAAMGVVRGFAVAGLEEAARRSGGRGLRVGAIDETSQVKQGSATAGVKRHYLGCVGKVANGITTVHLAYVRERTGHALIGARQWIPAGQIDGPVTPLVMGLPDGLQFRTKGQLAIDILTETLTSGITLDFVCGDEVYGACTELREFCEEAGQGYVLRVPSTFRLTLARGITMTCTQAVTRLLTGSRRWEVRRQGTALVCLGAAGHHLTTASPAGPPPPGQRRTGLPLLLRSRRAARGHGPADPRRRAPMASRRRFPVWQRLLRPRPVAGPPVYRDRPPHGTGHGRISDLRRHRRPYILISRRPTTLE